ncbi:hypothetical protein GOODEAATRI_021120 [Goodea atripinnis]|uniref:RING-type domain-containing protein n=1 Tax=Goodea atripinnis TaxID=208336 RepID=A0ABV0NCF8_9TELE
MYTVSFLKHEQVEAFLHNKMPIRAYCTICSDFFDHARDVAAIHCGHTFHYECLLQWFQTAPTKTCPQCRKQVSTRHIINKLFFDIGGEGEEGSADPESLQNELDRMKAVLSSKERDWRDKEKAIDSLKDTVNKQRRDLDSMRKEIMEKEMICVALRKQMVYLETQQNEVQAAKEEVRRLRTRMKTFEGYSLAFKCSLKSIVSSLKGASLCSFTKISSGFEAASLKTGSYFQRTFLCPRCSPAPLELKPPCLHQPTHGEDIDLNMTYDITTPDGLSKRPTQVPSKKMRLEQQG